MLFLPPLRGGPGWGSQRHQVAETKSAPSPPPPSSSTPCLADRGDRAVDSAPPAISPSSSPPVPATAPPSSLRRPPSPTRARPERESARSTDRHRPPPDAAAPADRRSAAHGWPRQESPLELRAARCTTSASAAARRRAAAFACPPRPRVASARTGPRRQHQPIATVRLRNTRGFRPSPRPGRTGEDPGISRRRSNATRPRHPHGDQGSPDCTALRTAQIAQHRQRRACPHEARDIVGVSAAATAGIVAGLSAWRPMNPVSSSAAAYAGCAAIARSRSRLVRTPTTWALRRARRPDARRPRRGPHPRRSAWRSSGRNSA